MTATIMASAPGNRPLIARVKNGRLVLDVPTNLPEGAEVMLHRDDELGDGLTPEEHAKLVEEIRLARRQLEAGEGIEASEFIARIRARRNS